MDALASLVIIASLLNVAFAGFLYAHSNKKAVITFYVLISVFASLWTLSTLLTSVRLPFPYFTYALYGHYIFGYLAYLSFYWFALYFPEPPRRTLIPDFLATTVSLVFIASIPFTHILFASLSPADGLAASIRFNVEGYTAFILMLSTVFFAGLLLLLARLRTTVPGVDYNGLTRGQIYFAILSNFVAGTLGIVLNLILPLYGNFTLFYVSPLFVIAALIGIGFYNLLKHHLFNVKVVMTEFFTAGVWSISFVQLLAAESYREFLISGVIFVGWLVFGILLIRSILREIRTREEMERLAVELKKINERQEGLLHFIGHEVKGFLAKDEGAFAALLDGDFGSLPGSARPFVEQALSQARGGVRSVTNILTASSQKTGKVTYVKEPFDLRQLIADTVEKLRATARMKGLLLQFSADETGAPYRTSGDAAKLKDNVFRNVIENALAYTPSGSVIVTLRKRGGTFVCSVKDTGVGIIEEDMHKLFTEGGHGKDSQKVNAHSTGYGLYIAKNIVEAHGGTIRAESAGQGKGSTFIIELPAQTVALT